LAPSTILRLDGSSLTSPEVDATFPSLAPETTNAHDAIKLSAGLGWGLYTSPYGNAFFKGGYDDGWRHQGICFSNGDGLLIMTNSSNGDGIFSPD
jgi:hypothetical protein